MKVFIVEIRLNCNTIENDLFIGSSFEKSFNFIKNNLDYMKGNELDNSNWKWCIMEIPIDHDMFNDEESIDININYFNKFGENEI